MTEFLKRLSALAVPLWLAGCALLPAEQPPVSDNAAVRTLVAQAGTDQSAGRHAAAAGALERALRIEPRNPRLWLELARLRLAQGDPGQAESIAARALSYAGSERRTRADCWQLIAEARVARGDEAGAAEAEARRREFAR